MAYCANCGVELGESEPKCPLCGYEPEDKLLTGAADAETPYPQRRSITVQHISRKNIIALITAMFLLPMCLTLVCDLSLNSAMTWSGYPVWALAGIWLSTILPIAMKKKRPVICVAVACGALVGYLFFIEAQTGGVWMMKFALPLIAIIFALIVIPLILDKYIKLRGLTLTSLILLSAGVLSVAVELLLNSAFGLHDTLRWSLYPAVSCTIISIILSIISRNEPLKDKLRKKFFI